MSTVSLTPAPVARPPLTGLDPIPLPADCHPVPVYLASHEPNSHALRHVLELAARVLTGGRFTAGARDAVLLAMLALCGPRRSELITLDLADYDATAGTLRVRGSKGNKDRLLVGNPRMGEALAEWLEVRGPMSESLFLPLTKAGKLCW